MYGYCWAHPIVCATCATPIQLYQLAADRSEPYKRTACPGCQAELIEAVREHLFTCTQSPEVLRRRARDAREAARSLVKHARELRERADVLMREAEVNVTQLRETTNQSASEALRRLVQAKLHEGSLPRSEISEPIPGGPGDGSTCRACEQPITDRQLMMLLPGPVPFPLHADCFQLWSEERRAFTSLD